MLVPGYPDGLEPIDVLRDLRFIKLSEKNRAIVLHLISEHKTRNLTLDEAKWVRSLARRHIRRVKELHKSYDSVRSTDAKDRMGHRAFEDASRKAKSETRKRLLSKLRKAKRVVEEAEHAEKDFGI